MRSTATAEPRLATLILLSALSILPVNLFLPSLPNIAAEFRTEYALASLSIAGYAGAAAVLQLLLGPLSDRWGRRPVLLSGLAIFVVASAGCALATSIWSFLAFRLLQSSVIVGYTVSLAMIRDTSSARDSASLIGNVATAWAVAPMLGPTLGGALDELLGWRAVFWAFVLFGLSGLALCWLDLRETNKSRSPSLARQFLSYPALLRSRRFWAYALCMTFSVGAFYAFLAGTPLVAKLVFGMSPASLGFFMGTITAGFVVGSFLSGRFASRYPLIVTILAGRLLACCGLIAGLVLLSFGIVHVVTFFGACAFVGLGNGLTMPGANAGVLSVKSNLAGSAAGMAGALTVAGGAVISSLTGVALTEDNSAYGLLGIMLLSSLLALGTAFYLVRLDRREQRGKTDPSTSSG